MNIPVYILYEQVKKSINDDILRLQKESSLPSFLIIAAIKELLCKYESDARTDLVADYQSLLSEIQKETKDAESIPDTDKLGE